MRACGVSRQPASTPGEAQTLTRPLALLRGSPRGRTDHSAPGASLPANRQLHSPALGVTSGRTCQGETVPEMLGGQSGRAPDPASASGWAGPGGPGSSSSISVNLHALGADGRA